MEKSVVRASAVAYFTRTSPYFSKHTSTYFGQKDALTLDKGTTCTAWNYSGQRLAAGSIDGTLSIIDAVEPASSSFTCTSKSRVLEAKIVKILWVPPEYGDAVACIFADGTFSIWEESVEDGQPMQWKLCKHFDEKSTQVFDVKFGLSLTSLKMVAAHSNGHVKIYELLDPMELKNWQLQAEFQNVIDSVSMSGKPTCLSAAISWSPQRGENPLSFVVGFNSDIPQLNSSKIWEFDEAHQRWLPVAELSLAGDNGDRVNAVAWAPNIGRPYEIIAVATYKGIAIWHIGLNPDPSGRLSVKKVALLSGHEGEVWEMEWDMSGMTLATSGSDGIAKLWQSNLNGIWHEQAALEPMS